MWWCDEFLLIEIFLHHQYDLLGWNVDYISQIAYNN